ncbi:MAG TPA: lysylphosphatidylglycerol synthase transmembrane domain-containing protein [Luteibacter sp.]|uniref:lysylphosphatidylglycerol synthase transmembrane domain-containing protein n=1 Tax=Luteibacter sp. TaxID=1886636 RepID=UPI002B6346DC|nr:lysylphosphatidylglycerol synthase transmembrane domain-containing protein [Luteibacter sp.]HVI53980.1 lysylphosphatidylglycerol synthase transmembrane domain-containing protein [Luteibacter sp.]
MKDASRSLVKRVLGWLVGATAMGFFIQRVVVHAGHMPHVAWDASTVAVGIASTVFAAFAIVLSGVIWQVLLRDQAIRFPWERVLSLYLVAQFGKYLPGNVGQYVGRVVLGRDMGIPVPVTLATMVTEALWGAGTALGLAALSLCLFFDAGLSFLPPWANATGLMICFLGLLASPWLSITLAKRFVPGLVVRVFGENGISPPGWLAALQVSFLYVACSLCMGGVLQWQSHYLFGAPPAPLLQVSGFFALAWLAGFALPGAPAGIGVRESIMVLLFTPIVGEGTALALSVTCRLATTLADVLAFVIGWVWRSAQSRSPQPPQEISQ